tara:strand:+ start:334 stop:528 length:195 start_codon:yes stop_codon:yes gene_type:complete
MGRIASDATLLRSAKAELALVNKRFSEATLQRDSYRTRASKAELEAAEWKARFDILLRREDKTK